MGPLEQYRLLHLTRPCLVDLGRVVIWVERQIVEFQNMFEINYSQLIQYEILEKLVTCIVNSQRDPAFCIGNCNIVFPLLNNRYTKLRRDSNPPKQSEDCYQSTPLPPSHHGWVTEPLTKCHPKRRPDSEQVWKSDVSKILIPTFKFLFKIN